MHYIIEAAGMRVGGFFVRRVFLHIFLLTRHGFYVIYKLKTVLFNIVQCRFYVKRRDGLCFR